MDCAYDGEVALQLYEINEYDLMVLDLNLPKISGLDLGSNDYLTMLFDFRALEARIRSLLRNRFLAREVRLRYGVITVDTGEKTVYVKEAALPFSNKILEYLMLHQDRVVSLEEIIKHVWNSDTGLFSNSFRMHMSSLRKKPDAGRGVTAEKLWSRSVGRATA